VPLNQGSNGGTLSCRNHLRRLNADPSLELFAIAVGPANAEIGTAEYLQSQGILGRFIAYQASSSEVTPAHSRLPWMVRRWPYYHEIDAREQSHIDQHLQNYVVENAPDCIVVDYLPSAFYIPSVYSMNWPVLTITLNRETDFYLDLAIRKVPIYGRPANRVAALRLRCREALTLRRSAAVVVIGKYDRPRKIFGRPIGCWVPPYMDQQPDPWSYSGSRNLFFVGNHLHFPNRDAIEWLATRLAPELQVLDPSIGIKIVGADLSDVPEAWRAKNIDYLGTSDARTLQALFRSEAALIAPISNDFGAKYKVAEAIAYGTPLLAPESAMSGVPFLPWLPRIELDKPAAAANAAKSLIDHHEAQRHMSAEIRASARTFIRSQQGVWGRVIRAAVARDANNLVEQDAGRFP
jgi:glycosyltransferase involved in cell wall biosynthesis